MAGGVSFENGWMKGQGVRVGRRWNNEKREEIRVEVGRRRGGGKWEEW